MSSSLRTLIVGFGQISSGFSEDPKMAAFFKYATHAQVLKACKEFEWSAVVDPDEKALSVATSKWGIPLAVKRIEELPDPSIFEVVVIATPPERRKNILDNFPNLKAVLLEKPIGNSLTDSQEFVSECKRRKISVQVNFWRRGDEFFQTLAAGYMDQLIGKPVTGFGLYGNGLMNNGSHMIDFVKMLFGKIIGYSVSNSQLPFKEGPIKKDINVPFSLHLDDNLTISFHPIPFSNYREVGMDIWGERGRISILQESLGIYYYPRKANRGLTDEFEIASDQVKIFPPTCGEALFRLYTNLYENVFGKAELWSSVEEAFSTDTLVHDIIDSMNYKEQR
jgi:predicted dehydrogenase